MRFRFVLIIAMAMIGQSCSVSAAHDSSLSLLSSQAHSHSHSHSHSSRLHHVRSRIQQQRQTQEQQSEHETSIQHQLGLPHVAEDKLWPKGIVYYKWDVQAGWAPLDFANFKLTLGAAMVEWRDSTCIIFSEAAADAQAPFVTFASSQLNDECKKNGGHFVNGKGTGVTRLCLGHAGGVNTYATRAAKHELGHVLGLYEMMQRSDAADYITLTKDKCEAWLSLRCKADAACIDKLWKSIYVNEEKTEQTGQYDYSSIMHYPLNNDKGIHPCYEVTDKFKDGNNNKGGLKAEEVGIHQAISAGDFDVIKALYKCK